jgi:hypothetical protein
MTISMNLNKNLVWDLYLLPKKSHFEDTHILLNFKFYELIDRFTIMIFMYYGYRDLIGSMVDRWF